MDCVPPPAFLPIDIVSLPLPAEKNPIAIALSPMVADPADTPIAIERGP